MLFACKALVSLLQQCGVLTPYSTELLVQLVAHN